MKTDTYRIEFDATVPLLDVEQLLHLTIFAAQGLFGEARVRMDVAYHLDEPHRVLAVDAASEVGDAVARMFTGLLIKEYGEEAFRVRRGDTALPRAAKEGQRERCIGERHEND